MSTQNIDLYEEMKKIIFHYHQISSVDLKQYENMPMQYAVFFKSCKNDNFQMKTLIFFLFFAQNINVGTGKHL